MRTEYLELIGAIALVASTAAVLSILNNKRKKALIRYMYSYSNVPKFIEHQLNSTHKKHGV